MRPSADVARVAIEAIRAQGRRVLIAHGWTDLALIDDRDDCFVVGEVNHQAVFGRVAAVVHHGGAGNGTRRPDSDRRGRRDPHRWGDGGRDAAGRCDQPRKATSVRATPDRSC